MTGILRSSWVNCSTVSTVSWSVSGLGMISTNFMMWAGLKKCMPIIRWGRLVAEPISLIDSAEVFEAKIVSGGQTSSSSL